MYEQEADALKKSNWPRCDVLAEQLAAQGPQAADALEKAAESRTHHVRSAALIGLAKVDNSRGRALAERLLTDKAYEVREHAARVLGVPVPK